LAQNEFDAQWKAWVRHNVERGCSKDELFRILVDEGFERAAVERELGHKPTLELAVIPNPLLAGGPGPDPELLPTLQKIQAVRPIELYTAEGFLDREHCRRLIELMQGHLRPSTITVENEPDKYFRRSKTADISFIDDPAVRSLDARICEALRLNPALAEPTQAQRYDVGDEFKAHTDYFESYELAKFSTPTLGQRTWTFMIYLNEPEAGGATAFNTLGIEIEPRTGMAVIWNSVHPNGMPNSNTLHQGTPVKAGYKAIVTKWFRAARRR
jgi:prolyl 4-hydroxylase